MKVSVGECIWHTDNAGLWHRWWRPLLRTCTDWRTRATVPTTNKVILESAFFLLCIILWQKEEQKTLFRNKIEISMTSRHIECAAPSPIHIRTHWNWTESQWKYQFTHILLCIIRRRIMAGAWCSRKVAGWNTCRPNGKLGNNNSRPTAVGSVERNLSCRQTNRLEETQSLEPNARAHTTNVNRNGRKHSADMCGFDW